MSSDARDVVRTRLLDKAFKPGEGVDQHGRPLAWSLDCRELTLHGPTLGTIAELLWPRVAVHQPDLIAGPSLSADPIVAALLLAAGRHGVELSGALLRQKPKGYGLRKLVEGPPVAPGVTAVVVDDVLTRGSSTARVVSALRELGAVTLAVITIVDLERDDRKRVEGIAYDALFTASELGLTPFREPPPLDTQSWMVRRINSPIPATRPVSPVLAGDEVILAGDNRGVLAVGPQGGVRVVLASETLCVAAADDLLVLGNATAVRAIDAVSLRRRWSVGLGARAVCCSPAGDVFVARDDAPEVLRVNARNGTVMARRTLESCADTLQVMGPDLLVAGRSGLAALDESLDTRWVRTEPARSLTTSGGGLFVLTSGPALTRLNQGDGSVAWSRRIGPRTLHQLVAAEDRVAFAVESVVVGLSGAGAVCWVHSAPRRIIAGPVACGPGALAIVDHGGIIRVLATTDGEHIASYPALSVQPIALAGSANTLVGISADGDAWGIDLTAQA